MYKCPELSFLCGDSIWPEEASRMVCHGTFPEGAGKPHHWHKSLATWKILPTPLDNKFYLRFKSWSLNILITWKISKFNTYIHESNSSCTVTLLIIYMTCSTVSLPSWRSSASLKRSWSTSFLSASRRLTYRPPTKVIWGRASSNFRVPYFSLQWSLTTLHPCETWWYLRAWTTSCRSSCLLIVRALPTLRDSVAIIVLGPVTLDTV